MVAEPEKISITAKLSAYYRQFTDIAFASEVATLIGAEDAYATLARDYGLDRDQLTPAHVRGPLQERSPAHLGLTSSRLGV